MPSVIVNADCSRCAMRDTPQSDLCVSCDGENFMDVFDLVTRLHRALDLLGVPAQAQRDPERAPPLRITVGDARKIMEGLDG